MIKVFPSEISGKISVISSKSFGHRELILAFLTGKEVLLKNLTVSEDILATISCLKALNAEISETPNGITVKAGKIPEKAEIFCLESGTTLRFMLVLAAALGMDCFVDGSERLRERPIKDLVELLKEKGISFSGDTLPFRMKGKLCAGKYEINGSVSSQFISALLLALPYLGEECEIIIRGKTVSAGYIDITLSAMEKYGIKVTKNPKGYLIGKQEYTPPVNSAGEKESEIEGDWSNAAFWIAAGALSSTDGLTVCGLNMSSVQGDKAIIDVLKSMGGNITQTKDGITAKKSKLTGMEIDAENIPDLVPIIAGTAAFAEGNTIIRNVERLREKESDRILAVLKIVNALGGDAKYEDNAMIITGNSPVGGTVDSFNDHRIAMTAAVMGLACKNAVTISGENAVNKSYPKFFELLKQIGGQNV